MFRSSIRRDVDLPVVFSDGPTTHPVMIKAKGDTVRRNAQPDRKARRLNRIFSGERTLR